MKVPRIIEEILNLTKQSCKNITTSKSYLNRKKKKEKHKTSFLKAQSSTGFQQGGPCCPQYILGIFSVVKFT